MTVYVPVYTTVAYIQAKTGLSNSEVDLTDDSTTHAIIEDAEIELEILTGRKFGNAQSITEFLSAKAADVIDNNQSAITLNHFPVQSITLFNTLDIDGDAVDTYGTLTAVQIAAGTFETDDYWLEVTNDPLTNAVVPSGRIRLKVDTFPEGTNNIKVTYTYGYSTVPVAVRDLATCLAGVRCWLKFLGAQYNRLNNYSIPQQSVNKGDFYQRGQQNIALLTDEANRLLDRIGRKPRSLIFITGDGR